MFLSGPIDWCQLMNDFTPRKPSFNEGSYADLSGKVYIVTEGCTGLGYHVTRFLIKKNAKVYMAARNQSKIDAAVEELKKEFPEARIDYFTDLSDLTSIKPGVQKFLDNESRLDGVVHNAGVMIPEPGSKTKQVHELQLGANVIGPWLLQKFLDHNIIQTAKDAPANSVRILWVSAAAHLAAKKGGINWDNPSEGIKWALYGQSKAINIMQAIYWSKHNKDSGVVSLSCHPGYLQTELQRNASGVEAAFIKRMLRETKYGAYTELFAFLSSEITTEDSGIYVVPFGKKGKARSDLMRTANEDDKLYNWLNDQVKDYFTL